MLIKYKNGDKLGLLIGLHPEGAESSDKVLAAAVKVLKDVPKTSVSGYWREQGIVVARIPDTKGRVRPRDAVQAMKRILTPSGLKLRCEV